MTIFLELLIIGGGALLGAGVGTVLGEVSEILSEKIRIFRNSENTENYENIRRRRGNKSGALRRRPRLDPERESLLMNSISDDVKILENDDIDSVENECSICLESFKVKDIVRTLSCSHIFHVECIEDWEKRQKNCPYCREEF